MYIKAPVIIIGKDIVLTAAHNAYSKDDKGWAKKIDVYAGVNGQTYTIGKAFSHKFFVSKFLGLIMLLQKKI